MKLGVYTAILHDRPLADALDVIASLGLNAAVINAGGFLPPVHVPIDDVIASQTARDDYLGIFAERASRSPVSTPTVTRCIPTRSSARSTPPTSSVRSAPRARSVKRAS
jgi:sugar phosphate isomerase/epimerase